jgi:RNA polymerase sigma-70 factor (ECF subfamily)
VICCNRARMRSVIKAEGKPGISGSEARPARGDAEVERQLVRRAQAGDHAAYEELVRTHQPRLLAVIGGILRRNQDVEDIAQQVLVKAYLSLNRFDLRSAFGTWLYKIAVNECWDYFRKKKVRRIVYESDLSDDQLRQMEATTPHTGGAIRDGDDAARRTQSRQLLDRLLDELDETDRSMLIMKEVSGFTVEEIGRVFGLNVNTVKVRMFRARGRVVEAYQRRLSARPNPPRKTGE